MMGIAAYQRLDVLASDGSLFALGARDWIPFTLSLKKRERDNKLYFGEGGDETPLLGMPFKNASRKKKFLKRKLMLVYTAMLGE